VSRSATAREAALPQQRQIATPKSWGEKSLAFPPFIGHNGATAEERFFNEKQPRYRSASRWLRGRQVKLKP